MAEISSSEYESVHLWLRKKFGSASKCENVNCNRDSKIFEWCLKKGRDYAKERKHFIQMCRLCHRRYDLGGKKQITKKRFVNARRTSMYMVRLYKKQHEIIKKSAKKLKVKESAFVRQAIEAASVI